MKITVGIHSYMFGKRLNWMLSSLLMQENYQDLIVDIALFKNEPSVSPYRTIDVIKYFYKAGLNIRPRIYSDFNRFQKRGYTRNDQIKGCTTDWIMFCDTDQIYTLDWFKVLTSMLQHRYKNCDKILHSSRFSTELDPTEDLIASYPFPIALRDPYSLCERSLSLHTKSSVGAGNCHIVKISDIVKKNGGVYTKEGRTRDRNWRCQSDMGFRRAMGWRLIPYSKLPRCIHLQHVRGEPETQK